MNELTKEELNVLNLLVTPVINLKSIQMVMDKKAQELGYENHQDFLIKTGWMERFVDE